MSFTAISILCSVFIAHLNEKTKTFLTEKNVLPKFIKLIVTNLVESLGLKKQAKQLLEILVKRDKELNRDQNNYAPAHTRMHSFDEFFALVANDLISKVKLIKCANSEHDELENINMAPFKRNTSSLNENVINKYKSKLAKWRVIRRKRIKISDLDYITQRENFVLYIYYEWVLVGLGNKKILKFGLKTTIISKYHLY